jgi:hypothetical protein
MSFRFRKRLRLAKLLRVNLAQSGASLSVGRRGCNGQRWVPRDNGHGRNPGIRRELSDATRQASRIGRSIAVHDCDRGRSGHRSSLVAFRAVSAKFPMLQYALDRL